MPLWTDAYLADTTHLTTTEHGAYLLLLMTMWRTRDKSLPNDDRQLAKYARLTPAQWRRIRPTVMTFFDVENDRITQGRLTDEANAVKQNSVRQSNKAKARWLKNKETGNAPAKPGECPDDASLSLSHISNTSPNGEGADAPNGQGLVLSEVQGVDLDKIFYERGKALLGKSSGGQLTKLKKALGLGRALEVIEFAKRKENPLEYIAGVLKTGPPDDDLAERMRKSDEAIERVFGAKPS